MSEQKLALVTGASRGLGAAMAETLAARGYHIMAVARTTGALEELDDRITCVGGTATLAPMDVSIPEAMSQMAQAIASRWGGLDLWVHAAIHGAPLAPAGHVDDNDWARSVSINMDATRGLIVLLDPLLRARSGTAMFFDDPRGGEKFFASYGATKAGQIALARSWQAESTKLGLRVMITQPQAMATGTRARFYPGQERDALASCRDEAHRLLDDAGY